ncbi:hypothetical protein [Pseudonocardia adelaidensis]|uniref:Uncharacterized protein n=1 Tax=Pseudonocardia adelaidensis TaxID=648754 RepID=A0ABP9NHN8_9PSEU
MDAGSFVIALLTAAGTAAGPAPLGALPDVTASAARCIAAPGEDRSGAQAPARLRAGSDAGLDRGQDGAAASSALAEELAQELADVVAESDDPTSRRLAAALAAAGFEASVTAGSGQQAAAARTDDRMRDDRMRADALDRNRMGTDDRLDRSRAEDVPDCADRGRQQDAGIEDDGLEDGSLEDGRGAASGANRSSDLDDVLSSSGSARSGRPSAPVERGGSGIAAALERGERTAG